MNGTEAVGSSGQLCQDWVSMVGAAQGRSARAVVTACETWSGAELLSQASAAARWLAGWGLPSRHPVPALLEASPEALALVLAGAAVQRPIAPLDPRMPARELAGCVERLDSPCIVAQPQFAARAQDLGPEVAVLGQLPCPGGPLPVPAPDDTAVVLHTSGTAGHPRGVYYRHDRLVRRVRLTASLQQLRPGSVFATAAPFHHIAGLGTIMVALAAGAATVPVARFSVDAWRDLAAFRVTHSLLTSAMLETLLRKDALRLRTLRVMQYGASPVHPETLRAAMARLPRVDFLTVYGQTEGSPITWLSPADHRLATWHGELLQSVGLPVPGVEVRISLPDGTGLGEVMARGDHLMAPSPDGWLRTGDLGRLDDDGYLYLIGRRRDVIIRGGENVHPLEIENLLVEHPQVDDAAVVGEPDEHLGEVVKAFVVAADPANPPSGEELTVFARSMISDFKVPARWQIVSSLPRSSTGKLLRRALVPR